MSGKSSTTSSKKRPLNLNPEGAIYIKVTVEDLRARINQTTSINAIAQEKLNKIGDRLYEIDDAAKAKKTSESSLLFRFHTGDDGLRSLAEQNNQTEIPEDVRNAFSSSHASLNIKHLKKNGDDYYSPYISMTEDLGAFVNTSFTRITSGTAGDTHIRQDVLERAEHLSSIEVNESFVYKPTNQLSSSEKEVIYDSSKSHLLDLPHERHENPLQGQIKINPVDLVLSRSVSKDTLNEALKLRNSQPTEIANPNIPFTITAEKIHELGPYLSGLEAFCEEVGALPKPILRPKDINELKAERMTKSFVESPSASSSSRPAGMGLMSRRAGLPSKGPGLSRILEASKNNVEKAKPEEIITSSAESSRKADSPERRASIIQTVRSRSSSFEANHTSSSEARTSPDHELLSADTGRK